MRYGDDGSIFHKVWLLRPVLSYASLARTAQAVNALGELMAGEIGLILLACCVVILMARRVK